MSEKDNTVYFIDPLSNSISVSENDAGVGDHPLRHGVAVAAIRETIEKPYRVYGHSYFPERCHYVRRNYEGAPDPVPKDPKQEMCLAVVEYTDSDKGKVVTVFYTDWLTDTVNIDDVKYDAYKERKKSKNK